MKIILLAPSHKSFISNFLPNYKLDELPEGYFGAPFIGIIIHELLLKGHEVVAITTTISLDNKFTIQEFSNNNFKWIVVSARKHHIRFNRLKLGTIFDFFAFERMQLRKIVVAHNSDIVHAHWSYEFAGALKKFERPYLVTIHDNPYQVLKYFKNAYRLGRLIMSEWVMHNLKYASTVSPYMKKYAKRRCDHLKLIPNPTYINSSLHEIKSFVTCRLEKNASPNIIMIMNGWDRRKNGDTGLKAFQLIKQEIPNSTLSLFGSGTQLYGPAYKKAQSLQLIDVTFHGPVNHSILLENLQLSNILIHPSLEESFGVVLIEAMATGLPVIGGVKSGAVPWVVDNKELLVDVSEAKNISNKVLEILSNPYLYENISLNCYENVCKRYASEIIVSQYENYYKKIIKSWK